MNNLGGLLRFSVYFYSTGQQVNQNDSISVLIQTFTQ